MKNACHVIAVAAAVTIPAHASTTDMNNTGMRLYEACKPIERATATLSNLSSQDLINVSFCLAYIHGVSDALRRLHDYYFVTLDDYGNAKNPAFVHDWGTGQLLLGYDVCFPDTMVPTILAMTILKQAREQPQTLSEDMYTFSGLAFSASYPCIKDGVKTK
jgi:hypothetical protein